MRVADGGYLSWVFGSDPRRIQLWNKSAVLEFSVWMNTVIIMEGGDLERNKFFPDYKAHRKEAVKKDPAATARRIRVHKFTRSMERDRKLQTVKFSGLEADDVLAAWAVLNWEERQTPMHVFGIDKDYLQMGQLMDIRKTNMDSVNFAGWKDKQQKTIQPVLTSAWHIALILALMGDISDNVPRLIPPRQLDIVLDIFNASNPWNEAKKLYGDDFLRNLYLTVLPGAWTFDPIPTPAQTFEIISSGGLPAWYQKPIRVDIKKAYDLHFEGKIEINGESK